MAFELAREAVPSSRNHRRGKKDALREVAVRARKERYTAEREALHRHDGAGIRVRTVHALVART